VAGLPDAFSESTVVSARKGGNTITRPANLPAGATWSAHIVALPIMNNDNVNSRCGFNTGNASIRQFLDSEYNHRMSTITVVTAADNVSTWPADGTDGDWVNEDPNSTRTYSTHAALEFVANGPMARLIAGGFEVHNDTPELYKSGSVTVYSMPQNPSKTFYPYETSTAGLPSDLGAGGVTLLRMPPNTPGAARGLRNARTWDAKQGVLVPFRMEPSSQTMEFSPMDNNVCILRAEENALTGIVCPELSTKGTNTVVPKLHMRLAAMETSGAYFSGLSYDSVLTLTTKFFVESAPTAANQDMLALASPPAIYNPDVLACYEHCMRTLPAGVPVGMNEKGDWWRMVLKTLREAVPLVLPAITKSVPQAKPFQGLATSALERGLDLALQRSEDRAAARRKTGPKAPVRSVNTNVMRNTPKKKK